MRWDGQRRLRAFLKPWASVTTANANVASASADLSGPVAATTLNAADATNKPSGATKTAMYSQRVRDRNANRRLRLASFLIVVVTVFLPATTSDWILVALTAITLGLMVATIVAWRREG